MIDISELWQEYVNSLASYLLNSETLTLSLSPLSPLSTLSPLLSLSVFLSGRTDGWELGYLDTQLAAKSGLIFWSSRLTQPSLPMFGFLHKSKGWILSENIPLTHPQRWVHKWDPWRSKRNMYELPESWSHVSFCFPPISFVLFLFFPDSVSNVERDGAMSGPAK